MKASILEPRFEQSSETFNKLKELGMSLRYDTIEYRDQEVNILSTVDGKHCCAQWGNQIIDLGLNNLYYKEEVCRFIDYTLDFITDFRDLIDFVGAKLEYFNNSGFRDIRLICRGRVLKVYITWGDTVNETTVISDSLEILKRYVNMYNS